MGNTFTQADWEHVRARAVTVAGQLCAKGADVWDFEALPPVEQGQLDQFTRATGLALPNDLADLLTRFAGGWTFAWSLGFEENPPVCMGTSGGNAEVPFIGATAASTLLDRYTAFQAEIRQGYRLEAGTEAMLPALLPLHTWDGGGGDYTVLRLNVTPAEVLFLDHERAWRATVIGTGFRDFVIGWANLGFPQTAYHFTWVASGRPDDASPTAERWRAWLADTSTAPATAALPDRPRQQRSGDTGMLSNVRKWFGRRSGR